MIRTRQVHVGLMYAMALLVGLLLFYTGWHMGKNKDKQQVVNSLKAGQDQQAAVSLAEWCKNDSDSKKDPIYYLSCAYLHLKKNNYDACRYNLEAALRLLEK